MEKKTNLKKAEHDFPDGKHEVEFSSHAVSKAEHLHSKDEVEQLKNFRRMRA